MKTKINWDALGIATSLACAIHCALLPLFLTSLPLLGFNIIENTGFEYLMILIAFAVADAARPWRVAGVAAASLALAAGVVVGAARAAGADRSDRLASYHAVLAWLDRHPGEILADQPMIPVLAGRRPFIIDSFIFRANVAADPTRLQPLLQALAARRFVAVVVDADAAAATPDGLMLESEFGPAYIRALLDNYRVDSTIWGRSVFVPNVR